MSDTAVTLTMGLAHNEKNFLSIGADDDEDQDDDNKDEDKIR